MGVLEQYLEKIVGTATSLVGSHYLHGGYGNKPGSRDGHPTFPDRVLMHQNVLNPPGRLHDNPPRQLIFAAACDSDRRMICAGRSEVHERKRAELSVLRNDGLLARQMQRPSEVLWPRPNGSATAPIVFGEACMDIRHFDCIGFVNYCVWRTTGAAAHHPSIAQVFRWWMNNPIERTQVQPGDIALWGNTHIGIVIGASHMVHAKSELYGVVRDDIGAGKAFFRPTERFFRSVYLS